jgi:copper chaperone
MTSQEQVTLDVEGMTCGGCENAVGRALKATRGVLSVRASYQEKKVWVEFDPILVGVASLKVAISQAGYIVR